MDPFVSLLCQGASPRQLGWSVAVGITLGVIPFLGISTMLCALVALPLRLNLVAIQVANYAVYPLQFLLILPFYRAGAWLFKHPPLSIQPSELAAMFTADFWGSLQALWTTTWQGLIAWLLCGIPATIVFFICLYPLFQTVARRIKTSPTTPAEDRS